MCYFLNLSVRPQRYNTGAQIVLQELANAHGLHLRGQAPIVQITDGHCSCHQVTTDGRGIRDTGFLEELTRAAEIKNVKVGWIWAAGPIVQMPEETVEQRLSLSNFLAYNRDNALRPAIWYRLHDEERYSRDT